MVMSLKIKIITSFEVNYGISDKNLLCVSTNVLLLPKVVLVQYLVRVGAVTAIQ